MYMFVFLVYVSSITQCDTFQIHELLKLILEEAFQVAEKYHFIFENAYITIIIFNVKL